jgi:hypothetical protein
VPDTEKEGFVIHLASFEVVVHGRLLQRCAVCGCRLVDSGPGSRIYVVQDGEEVRTDPPVEIFQPQSLVVETGGAFKPVSAPDDFYPPRGGCIELVED